MKRFGAKATKNLKDTNVTYQEFAHDIEMVELLEETRIDEV